MRYRSSSDVYHISLSMFIISRTVHCPYLKLLQIDGCAKITDASIISISTLYRIQIIDSRHLNLAITSEKITGNQACGFIKNHTNCHKRNYQFQNPTACGFRFVVFVKKSQNFVTYFPSALYLTNIAGDCTLL